MAEREETSPPLDPRSHRGRGARLDTGNRFTGREVELDLEEVTEDDLRVKTRYLDDTSRSAVATNNSPDIGFDVSINPYRGCEHGCSYCMDGETLVLMVDGSSKRLSELVVGDHVFGTERSGHYRRLVPTTVLDKWTTKKPSYRITLHDGTTLIASGDHRFLTERGWKHVVPAQTSGQRPYLTTNNRLLGWGAYGNSGIVTDDYRQGYLTGMIRGDGLLGHYVHERGFGGGGSQYQFRLALKDDCALERTQSYLARIGVNVNRFEFTPDSDTRAPMRAIRTHRRADYELISLHIDLTGPKSLDWRRGFLAGFYDAEGSQHGATLSFTNSDPHLLRMAEESLEEIGLASTRDPARTHANVPVQRLRLLGGAAAALRFVTAVDPAVRRKTRFDGLALKSDADLRIASIEPWQASQVLYDITTGTGDFMANGVVSHNCYARPTHEYLGFSAGLDFERIILVKRDAAHLLEQRLRSPSWKPQVIAISGVTDPYQPVERKLRITRSVLEVLARFRNPVGLITKNALVTRDLDLLAEMAAWNGAHVAVSVTTLDEGLRAKLEPRTSTIANRLAAISRLAEAGVPVGVNVAPIIPGLTDHEVPDILAAVAAAGAQSASYTLLRLPGAVAQVFEEWLEANYPLRKDKVLNRVREAHGGDVADSVFGRRMRGSGEHADRVRDLFHLTCKRLGLTRDRRSLEVSAFRVPGSTQQPSLF
ncbi:MAG TPA: PA0069 family radical SAM protein [Trueperaceae bacterium]